MSEAENKERGRPSADALTGSPLPDDKKQRLDNDVNVELSVTEQRMGELWDNLIARTNTLNSDATKTLEDAISKMSAAISNNAAGWDTMQIQQTSLTDDLEKLAKIVEEAQKSAGTKFPKDCLAQCSIELKKFNTEMSKFQKVRKHIDKIEKEVAELKAMRLPPGCPRFTVAAEFPELDSHSVIEELDKVVELPSGSVHMKLKVGTTFREAFRSLHFMQMLLYRELDYKLSLARQAELKKLVDYSGLKSRFDAVVSKTRQFDEFGLTFPADLFAEPETEKFTASCYRSCLTKLKSDALAEEAKKEKQRKQKEQLERQTALLNPREIFVGMIKQIVKESGLGKDSKNKPDAQVDYYAKNAGESEFVLPKAKPKKKQRKWTKQQLNEWKGRSSTFQRSQVGSLGTIPQQKKPKAKASPKAEWKPKPSPKPKGKGKGKGKQQGSENDTHGKGKTGKGKGKMKKGRGKGKGQ